MLVDVFDELPIDVAVTNLLDIKMSHSFLVLVSHLKPMSGFPPSLKYRHSLRNFFDFGFDFLSFKCHICFLTFDHFFQVDDLKIPCSVQTSFH